QFTFTQPLTVSATPGETVQLACVLSSGDSISGSYIRWYQQKQGEKPRYLLYYKDDSTQHKASGVPDRFTASKDTSGNTCFLAISRAQAEDDADYYCSDWDNRANQHTVIQLHREEEQKPLSPIVTQRLEPTCVSLVPMRWPGTLAPVRKSNQGTRDHSPKDTNGNHSTVGIML
uniref:Ig-like domain-containing protein n=1 Tax=Chelydra serpentina TaxID=8475 RepID=A0A8C3S9B0_CHESE